MTLEELRKEIDRTDDVLTAAFVRRLQLASEIGAVKRESGADIRQPAREAEVLERVCRSAGEFSEEVARLYGTVFAVSRDCQSGEQKAST